MGSIEKTVFICYRRTNEGWALAIYQDLTHKGYDVFIDYLSINSGDFEQIITENIRARAHFLILLTPSALERCDEPNDWFRREMEIALDCKRNIIPMLLEGFDFGAQETLDYLTGELKKIQKYNGLPVNAAYFNAVMERLCNCFLNIPLDNVLHPVSPKTQQVIDEQKRVIAKQAPVEEKTLSAQEWYERAFKSKLFEEKVRLFTQSIETDPKYYFGYNDRGIAYCELKQFDKALEDFDQAIKLDPNNPDAYNNRGNAYKDLNQVDKALKDYDQAIKLNPELAIAYNNRGNAYKALNQFDKALEDYDQAIKLNPEFAIGYNNRGNVYTALNQFDKALKDYDQAIKLNPKGSGFYNKACLYALQGKVEDASKCLLQSLKIDSQKYCELICNDKDFDRIRVDDNFQKLIKEFCDKY